MVFTWKITKRNNKHRPQTASPILVSYISPCHKAHKALTFCCFPFIFNRPLPCCFSSCQSHYVPYSLHPIESLLALCSLCCISLVVLPSLSSYAPKCQTLSPHPLVHHLSLFIGCFWHSLIWLLTSFQKLQCNALSQMSRQIINMPHQCHYSRYVLIYYALCSGVFKDCESPFSLNYVCLKNNLNLQSNMWLQLLVVCYLQVLWN